MQLCLQCSAAVALLLIVSQLVLLLFNLQTQRTVLPSLALTTGNESIFGIKEAKQAQSTLRPHVHHTSACKYLKLFRRNQSQFDFLEFNMRFNISTPKLLFPQLLEFVCKRLRPREHHQSLHNQSNTKISRNSLVEATRTSKCLFDFTVYVYPVSEQLSSLRVAEEARRNRTLHVCRKCILEQFSLEYIIYDFFTQFCGRTNDPSTADFFYIPMVRDAELRWLMEKINPRNRPPFPAEVALLELLEKNSTLRLKEYFNISDHWWLRNQGADHIIGIFSNYSYITSIIRNLVMPAPVTNLRHERNARGFFHYMLHLRNPIFVAIEYSRSFIEEYPFCSRHKNILVPYPTIDPELFSNRWTVPPVEANRSALIFYSGGLHGDCMQVREALHQIIRNSTGMKGIVQKRTLNMARRESGFSSSTFCPVPIGDSPSSKRMYDVLNFGCIPVILSDDLVWAFSNFSGGSLDPSMFSIQLPQSVVQYSAQYLLKKYSKIQFGILPKSGTSFRDLLSDSLVSGGEYIEGKYVNPLIQILLRIPYEDILFLRENVRNVAPLFRYYRMKAMNRIPIAHHMLPDGEAISELARLLDQRKSYGVARIEAACKAERERKNHKYLNRYPCDNGKQKRRNFRV